MIFFKKGFILFAGLCFLSGLYATERPDPFASFDRLVNSGKAIDSIKEYHETGALKSVVYMYKKKYKFNGKKFNYSILTMYDETGHCIRYMNDWIGCERKYDASGHVISELIYERRKSRLKYYAEYFPDGMKKSVISSGNRYDYDEKERLRRHWERKSVRYNKKYGILAATFYFEEYDVSGNISKSGRFYTNLFDHDQWLHIAPEFPVDLESVSLQDFKEIVYPQMQLKDVYRWDYVNNKTIITRFELNGDNWIELKQKTYPRFSRNRSTGYARR
jgi:hypothetical protein